MTVAQMAAQTSIATKDKGSVSRQTRQTWQVDWAPREGRCLFQNQCSLPILYNTGYKNSISRHAAQAYTLFSLLVRTSYTLEFISWRCSQTITITTTCVILSLTHSLTQAFTLKFNKLWQRILFDVARIPHGWFSCHFWVPKCRKKQEHTLG